MCWQTIASLHVQQMCCKMFHFIHQLVTYFVCLLFGAGEPAYSLFIKAYWLKIYLLI